MEKEAPREPTLGKGDRDRHDPQAKKSAGQTDKSFDLWSCRAGAEGTGTWDPLGQGELGRQRQIDIRQSC